MPFDHHVAGTILEARRAYTSSQAARVAITPWSSDFLAVL